MANQANNPFVLPGFGQGGDMARNPMMASMEMMRQAWQGLATGGGFEHSALTPPMSIEDLDRRISDLRAVENWLRMNLSMLSSTIQGLEVQRATIMTLQSFAASSGVSAGATPGPSPLDVVLGIKPGQAAAPAPTPKDPAPEPSAPPAAESPEQKADPAIDMSAAQGWWDMLQKQFDALAAATAATLQNAEAARPTSEAAAEHAKSSSTMGSAPGKTARKSARSTSTARPARKVARKTASRKRTRSSSDTDS
ncbi:transcriptional regulator [Pusillimonas sp. MFBS29]|uniref:PhaM family polyhydroxyalkanoate granule multifunctional regulatory protein n=1 Tax=Pusillimonas sp. MFBS29 TaxID=2886690 RepID=UPI001D1076D0|nr:PhaM family polyhydroxyalkanoate granule multifunctional regulatory protein [Pusillimonas sp. MFBS29]MCC2595930.1 transcriptional regulator [Pusillimonas sp. MFBS29]